MNGNIHIGHLAGYLLPADIFARFHRFIGNDVLMVSGSDCFGTPITVEADKRGVLPKEIVNEYHKKAATLFRDLGISYDIYTKTDTENHKKIAQEFFLALLEKGYVFKGITKEYYSETDKKFLPDRYVEGECANCGFGAARSDQCDNCGKVLGEGDLKNPKSKLSQNVLSLKETEHYFLDWPKLEPFLKKYFSEKGGRWRDWVRRETEGWLNQGLKPRAITRDIDWGVPLPIEKIPKDKLIEGAPGKRLYVWFEAVIGYFSASLEWATGRGEPEKWREWWQNEEAEHYYFMGKDNLVFHALFWPGEIYGYNETFNLPDSPVINHFLSIDGKQFSKSRGVIIDSREITEKYGNDPVRFYLVSIMPETTDANFTWESFWGTNNNILIANFGNFIMRTLTLSEGLNLKGELVAEAAEKEAKSALQRAKDALIEARFKEYVQAILDLSDFGNKYLARTEPWKIKKENLDEFEAIVSSGVYLVLVLLALLKPLLPETYEKLSRMTGVSFDRWPSEKELIRAVSDVRVKNLAPLFRKIENT